MKKTLEEIVNIISELADHHQISFRRMVDICAKEGMFTVNK